MFPVRKWETLNVCKPTQNSSFLLLTYLEILSILTKVGLTQVGKIGFSDRMTLTGTVS